MKFDIFKFLILLVVVGLLSWAAYTLGIGEEQKTALCIGSAVLMTICSAGMSLKTEDSRDGVNVNVLLGLYFVVSIAIGVIYSFFEFSMVSYLVPCGVLLALVLLAMKGILGK